MKKVFHIVLVILCILLILSVLLASVWMIQYFHHSPPSSVRSYETDNPLISSETMSIGHRFGGGLAPENTMMALKEALNSDSYQIDGLEFDLHLTEDGIPVVFHDSTLDRTTDSLEVFGTSGVRPEDKTYEELLQLNLGVSYTEADGTQPYASLHGSDVPKDLQIMTLQEALDLIQASGKTVLPVLEIKSEGDAGKQLLDILYSELSSRDMLSYAVLGTFLSEIAEYADETYPDLMRGAYMYEVIDFYLACLTDRKDFTADYEVLQLPYGDFLSSYSVNFGVSKVINYAHEHNIAVQFWTVDDSSQMDYLISIQADGITSNRPDLVYQTRTETESR